MVKNLGFKMKESGNVVVDFSVFLVPHAVVPGDKFLESLFDHSLRKVESAQNVVVFYGLEQLVESDRVVTGRVGMFEHLDQNCLDQFFPLLHYFALLNRGLLQVLSHLLRGSDNNYLLSFRHGFRHCVRFVDFEFLAHGEGSKLVLDIFPEDESVLNQHV